MATNIQQSINHTKPNDLAFTANVNIVVPRQIFVNMNDAPRTFDFNGFFSLSSLIGFLVDYSLYSLLLFILTEAGFEWEHRALMCHAIARVVSASVNFTINYHLVFKKRETVWKALLKYTGLALFILFGGMGILYVLTELWGWNPYLAKILVEVTMFIVSWLVQRLFVFRKRKNQ
jgi:putative flippase GtrA